MCYGIEWDGLIYMWYGIELHEMDSNKMGWMNGWIDMCYGIE